MAFNRLEKTAELLLDYIGSDDERGWLYLSQFGEWEALFNPESDRRLIGRLARILENRSLVEIRRASAGMQICITGAGLAFCEARKAHIDAIHTAIDWSAVSQWLDDASIKVDN